jgi:alcohol dehydrogenase YqhD (iron-dependent ADH family)
MHSFTYYTPTRIYFGKDTVDNIAEYVGKYLPENVMIVYGGGSIVRSGLLEKIEKLLSDAGIKYTEFGGARPNPTLEHAYEGIKLGIEKGVDFILAVGGGSAIDTAKGICHGIANPDTDIWDYWIGTKQVEKTLPLGCVLTIPAAGSEMSHSSVLTNMAVHSKRGLTTDLNRPLFAVMDPTLTYTLPVYQIGCGVTDIMMHTMDRYFNPLENELTDAIAEALLRTVIKFGTVAIKNSHDYEAMSELMWAGSLSHNNLTGLGGINDFAPHQLGHEITVKYDTAHGASLATIWSSWARYVYDAKPSRFARFARNVWGITETDDNKAAIMGIQATEDYFKSLGMPVCFSDVIGIKDDSVLKEMATGCSRGGTRTIGSFKVLDENDIYEIYKIANR